MDFEDKDAPSQSSSEILCLRPLPPYDGNEPGEPSAHVQNVSSEHDDFGTVVTAVTIVTTRKKYRVES